MTKDGEKKDYYGVIKKRAKEIPEFRKIIRETKSRTIELSEDEK